MKIPDFSVDLGTNKMITIVDLVFTVLKSSSKTDWRDHCSENKLKKIRKIASPHKIIFA